MSFLKRFPVAVALTALVVIGCGTYALIHTPVKLPDVKASTYVYDGADVLSSTAEQSIKSYNSSFDKSYSSYVAVLTVPSTKGWDETEFAAQVFDRWGLQGNDFLLVLDTGAGTDNLYYGSNYSDFPYDSYLTQYVDTPFAKGDCDSAVLNLMAAMDSWLAENAKRSGSTYYDSGYHTQGDAYEDSKGGFSLMSVLLLVLILLFLIRGIDRARYRSWYGQYGHMPVPPVVFRPIFFWHNWYRRPPYPPGGFGSFGGGYRPQGPRSYGSRRPPSGGFGGGFGHGGGGFGGGGGHHGGGGFGGGGRR